MEVRSVGDNEWLTHCVTLLKVEVNVKVCDGIIMHRKEILLSFYKK